MRPLICQIFCGLVTEYLFIIESSGKGADFHSKIRSFINNFVFINLTNVSILQHMFNFHHDYVLLRTFFYYTLFVTNLPIMLNPVREETLTTPTYSQPEHQAVLVIVPSNC